MPPTIHVGVDVSQATLAVHVQGEASGFTVANTPAGHEALLAALTQRGPLAGCRVLVEATGKLELPVAHALAAAGVAVHRINPKQAKDLRCGLGRHGKTDASDAAVLAAIAAMDLCLAPLPSPAVATLQEWMRHRHQLVNAARQWTQRAQRAITPEIRSSCLAQARQAAAAQRPVLAAIKALVRTQPEIAALIAHLQTIPGIGWLTACTLVAHCPFLGQVSGKVLASFVGVAPHPQDSGVLKGTRRIRGGHPAIRAVLYMAAMTARRCNPRISAFADELAAKGKPGKVVIVACMRKLLDLVAACARDQADWDPNRRSRHRELVLST